MKVLISVFAFMRHSFYSDAERVKRRIALVTPLGIAVQRAPLRRIPSLAGGEAVPIDRPACCNAPRERAFYRKISLLGHLAAQLTRRSWSRPGAGILASPAAAKHLVTTRLEPTTQNRDNP